MQSDLITIRAIIDKYVKYPKCAFSRKKLIAELDKASEEIATHYDRAAVNSDPVPEG